MIFEDNVFKPIPTKYIECDCQSIEHLVRIMYDSNPNWGEIYFDVRLNNNLNFFKRLAIALKYLFKLPVGSFGDYECCSISKHRLDELISMFKEIKDGK